MNLNIDYGLSGLDGECRETISMNDSSPWKNRTRQWSGDEAVSMELFYDDEGGFEDDDTGMNIDSRNNWETAPAAIPEKTSFLQDEAHVALKNAPVVEDLETDQSPQKPPLGAISDAASLGVLEKEVVPRDYQLRLFEKAKEGNVLAVLDTGVGKTLIALLLIKHVHIASLDMQADNGVSAKVKKKVSIFLVPAVPLVSQQATYLRKNCDLHVSFFHGARGVDQWTSERWRTEIHKTHCMVMTPAVLENILRRAFITMDEISLIVFDECHHARKNSMYNQIMSFHYLRCPEHLRPKIFGMTASPLNGRKDARAAIKQLETNLCSTAFTAEDLSDLHKHVNRPSEEVKLFTPTSSVSPFIQFLAQHGAESQDLLLKQFKDAVYMLDDLGSWCADDYIREALRSERSRMCKKINATIDTLTEHERRAQLEAFEKFLSIAMQYVEEGEGVTFSDIPDLEQLSPKMKALIEILLQYRDNPDGFCGIIFTERRSTAAAIKKVVSVLPQLNFLRSNILVGHGGSGSQRNLNFHANTVREQRKAVDDFKSGALNLLIATKVAEEGLDIQPCNLVIRFDLFQNVTQYVQSRGRARHPRSRYVLLVPNDNADAIAFITKVRDDETLMRDELIRDRVDDFDDSVTHDVEVASDDVFHVPTTGATVNSLSALGLINQYCNCLPQDAYSVARPEFTVGPSLLTEAPNGIGWVSEVQMPINAPSQVHVVSGPVRPSKMLARKSAAVEVVRRLHAIGELDDRLMPVRLGKLCDFAVDSEDIVSEEARGVVESDEAINSFDISVPKCFRTGWKAELGFLLLIRVQNEDGTDRVLDLGLLVPGKICTENSMRIDLLIGEVPTYITIHQCSQPCLVNQERLEQLIKYQFVLFSALLRNSKTPEENAWSFLTVPLDGSGEDAFLNMSARNNSEQLIDWRTILAVSYSSWATRCSHSLVVHNFKELFDEMDQELVVGDRQYWDRKYRVYDVLTESTPYSDPVDGFANVAEFYKIRLNTRQNIVEDQPLLLAKVLPHIFQSGKTQEESGTDLVLLIPQFCTPFPITATVLTRSALYIPLVIRTLNHRLQVLDLRDRLNLEKLVAVNDMQAALTAPSAWWIRDYERLEFLGDAFLKLHISLHMFVNYPDKHEGWLTKSRKDLERNTTLCNRGKKFGFPGAIVVEPLSRKAWKTPALIAIQKQDLSTKTIADTVEAVIGAAVVCSNVTGGASVIRRLFGDKFLVDWKKYALIYKTRSTIFSNDIADSDFLEKQNAKIARSIEVKAGYKFNDLALVGEAMTHTSALGLNGATACYQRLEFLGDSALGFIVANNLYLRSEKFPPSYLTDLRSELVNNQFLAVAAYVSGLHKLIVHMSPTLASHITEYGKQLDKCRYRVPKTRPVNSVSGAASGSNSTKENAILFSSGELVDSDDEADAEYFEEAINESENQAVLSQPSGTVCDGGSVVNKAEHMSSEDMQIEEKAVENIDEKKDEALPRHNSFCPGYTNTNQILFWHELPSAPKAISDVLEALLGAVLLDSDCDIRVVSSVIEKLLIEPWWQFFVAAAAKSTSSNKVDLSGIQNPLKEFHMLASSSRCKEISMTADFSIERGGYTYTISKHGVLVASGFDKSRRAAKRAASTLAVPKLKSLLDEEYGIGDLNCNCRILDKDPDGVAAVTEALNGATTEDSSRDGAFIAATDNKGNLNDKAIITASGEYDGKLAGMTELRMPQRKKIRVDHAMNATEAPSTITVTSEVNQSPSFTEVN